MKRLVLVLALVLLPVADASANGFGLFRARVRREKVVKEVKVVRQPVIVERQVQYYQAPQQIEFQAQAYCAPAQEFRLEVQAQNGCVGFFQGY